MKIDNVKELFKNYILKCWNKIVNFLDKYYKVLIYILGLCMIMIDFGIKKLWPIIKPTQQKVYLSPSFNATVYAITIFLNIINNNLKICDDYYRAILDNSLMVIIGLIPFTLFVGTFYCMANSINKLIIGKQFKITVIANLFPMIGVFLMSSYIKLYQLSDSVVRNWTLGIIFVTLYCAIYFYVYHVFIVLF